MRKGDRTTVSVIRMIRSAIGYEEIANGGSLDYPGILEIISKQANQRRESIEQFLRGNRQDLVDKERSELEVILKYLPAQLDTEAIRKLAIQAIASVRAQGLQDKGKVMGHIMPQVKGKADGSQVNQIVTELLS
jgi:hypothetical protein